MKMMIRHGDVIIHKVGEIPEDAKVIKDRNWLALGEVTGHAHRVDIVDSLFETKNGQLYLKVNKTANLTHEEHKTIVLNPGIYRVVIKRQYSPDGWERVAD